ncbi:hypothetical protein SUGI_0931760 [Cryptomeria japonica]|nr:hypothetical protein SUGI_0931760 [Cryptomeria japonica]
MEAEDEMSKKEDPCPSFDRKRKARDDNTVEAAWDAFQVGVVNNDFFVLKTILGSNQKWISNASASRVLNMGYGLAFLYKKLAK